MQKSPPKTWRQRSWVIPASVLLHVLVVGAFFLQWPEQTATPAEPESVSVEIVPPPPEPEAPAPEPEAEKPEEKPEAAQPPPPPPPPPPAEEKPEEPETPMQSLPSIPIRPDPPQMDAEDNPGQPEEPVEETTQEDKPETPETPNQPPPPPESSAAPPPSESADGELPPVEKSEETAEDIVSAEPQPEEAKEEKPKLSVEEEAIKRGEALPETKEVLSNRRLANPSMRHMLGELPPNRRIVQMCSIEALEQLRSTRSDTEQPVGIVPFSDKGGLIQGRVLNATGGAYNTGQAWYGVDFYCEVDLDDYVVTSFRMKVGASVPKSEWAQRGFPKY